MAIDLKDMDVDNFKTINDIHGHQYGDTLLETISQCIGKNIRSTDVVARLGGDEFAILLIETGGIHALRIIKKVRLKLNRMMKENLWPVTFSFGVVTFRNFELKTMDMLNIADGCMYEAKKTGKNLIKQKIIK